MSENKLCIRENFLTGNECRQIIKAIDTVLENFEPDNFNIITTLPLRSEIAADSLINVGEATAFKIVTEIRTIIIAEISGYFKCANIYPEYTLLTRMEVGSDTELHADSERNENGIWIPNHTPVRSHTGMLYLNTCNEDYTGGEIVFPEVGEKITPKAGMLVGFKTTHEYVHQVLPILTGHRYALSFWMTQNEAHNEKWG